MKTNKIKTNLKKILLISSLVFTCLFISSCNKDDKTLVKITVAAEATVVLDEFDYTDVLVKLIYDDYSVEKVNLSKDMLSSEDLNKLSTIGTHKITVSYLGFKDEFTISITNKLDNESFILTIFELNDTHGHIEQSDKMMGGLSNTAQIIEDERCKNNLDDVVLIANGDMFQGTAISNLTEGRAMVEAMNEMNFDMMGIGNHEFDWGLHKILKFFDGDLSNSEANFPLLNANIYEKSSNELLMLDSNKMFESTIIKKEEINVGLVSFIDNLESSINASVFAPYYIKTDFEARAKRICSDLKDQGADVIIVNIHGGDSGSVNDYYINNILSNITYNGKYLVDAIINGHTHTRQKGFIERSSDVSVPVVQSSGNNKSIGRIELTIDNDTKDVTSTKVVNVDVNNTSYNNHVESVVDYYSELIGNEVFSIAGEPVSSEKALGAWASAVLRCATGASVAIINSGGIRSSGNINKGDNITINNVYEICPFNNQIYTCFVKGRDIYRYLANSRYYYYSSVKDISEYQNDENYYLVSTVDYVFNGGYFLNNKDAILEELYLTDLLVEELRLQDTFYISKLDNILIEKKVNR